MNEISTEELNNILGEHKFWLSGKGGKIADLSYADLSNANLNGADLSRANLSYADLSYADLSRANLSYADLSYADLSNANLNGANLSRANLCGANLRDVDLRDVDLRNADLSGADLRDADLDYSSIYLGCKDLDHHIDDKLAIQRLYHTLRNVKYSKNVSQEIKDKLLTDEMLEIANRFHRIEECGKIIKVVNDTENEEESEVDENDI
jgi:uncharacterized protein YjbI with pentapeptide repeats